MTICLSIARLRHTNACASSIDGTPGYVARTPAPAVFTKAKRARLQLMTAYASDSFCLLCLRGIRLRRTNAYASDAMLLHLRPATLLGRLRQRHKRRAETSRASKQQDIKHSRRCRKYQLKTWEGGTGQEVEGFEGSGLEKRVINSTLS